MEDRKSDRPRKNGSYRKKDFHDEGRKGGFKGKGNGSDRRDSGRKGGYDRSDRSDFRHSSDDKRPGGFRKRSDRRGSGDRRSGGDRNRSFDRGGRRDFSDRRGFERNDREEKREERKLLLPQDASRLLYRGIDCLEKDNPRLAMIMFLHGSVMLSEGCEKNAARMISSMDNDAISVMRSDIKDDCSIEALIEFDYICLTIDGNHNRNFFDSFYDDKNLHAIYRKIYLEEIEGDDTILDVFASRYQGNEDKVVKGLTYEKRRKDSPISEAHLKRFEDQVNLKRSVYTLFTRSVNGDASAAKELKGLSDRIPEAAFFSEFLVAKEKGEEEEWIRSKYDQYKELIISEQGKFGLGDTPFGMYLKAKNLESKKEEWMSIMMNAAKAGSQEAIDELSGKMFRNDVKKCLASIHLKNGDIENLILVYRAGLDDDYYLDQYCADDQDKIIAVGAELGKQSVGKEIEWLKDHGCKEALISKSEDEFYQCKSMIYALHDIGEDLSAAKLYFQLEGNPEIPSVKWLKKVCGTDEVKDFVREHYESKGDSETFDFIFKEDGYEHRPRRDSQRRGPPGRGRR